MRSDAMFTAQCLRGYMRGEQSVETDAAGILIARFLIQHVRFE